MNKKLKIFMMVLSIILASTVCFACSKKQNNKKPPANVDTSHTHSFSQLTGNESIDFCAGCNGYLVKGTGSSYLEVEESPQTLEEILTD